MADYNAIYQGNIYYPDQQDLLAGMTSNNPSQRQEGNTPSTSSRVKTDPDSTSPQQPQSSNFDLSSSGFFNSPAQDAPGSGHLGFGTDESPFLDFDPEADFDFPGAEQLIGDIPEPPSATKPASETAAEESETREKRKSVEGKADVEEKGKKRRESDDKSAAKKPGRKPLTSEPTSKRKAQNRAAQRAFRERKEKHLRDLENKVEVLEKASESANHENGLLRAQVERLQVELREYRKRLSWLTSGAGFSPMNAIQSAHSRSLSGLSSNDFYFDFPKFGDLPGAHIFNNGSLAKPGQTPQKENMAAPMPTTDYRVPGVLGRDALGVASTGGQAAYGTTSKPPSINGKAAGNPAGTVSRGGKDAGIDSRTGSVGTQPPASTAGYSRAANPTAATQKPSGHQSHVPGSTVSNSDSPCSSSESQHGVPLSSSGTSPEPGRNSPSVGKSNDQKGATSGVDKCGLNSTIDGEKSFCEKLGLACGNINNPVPAIMNESNRMSHTPGQYQHSADQQPLGFDWLAQQNGGQFDPVLFGDYRDPQEAVLSQDFGTFFNDAFPLPDLGSPFHNLNDVTSPPAPKKDLITEIDNKLDDDEEEVVPGEDKSQMMTCTKIWDRLQSMEKFRNGEIDVDHLCTELRTKARCSEGGVVVNEKDVEDIMGRVQ